MDLLPKMKWKQARDYSKSMSLRKLFFSDPHPLVTPKTTDDGRTRCITIKTRKETRFRRNMIRYLYKQNYQLPNVNKKLAPVKTQL